MAETTASPVPDTQQAVVYAETVYQIQQSAARRRFDLTTKCRGHLAYTERSTGKLVVFEDLVTDDAVCVLQIWSAAIFFQHDVNSAGRAKSAAASHHIQGRQSRCAFRR